MHRESLQFTPKPMIDSTNTAASLFNLQMLLLPLWTLSFELFPAFFPAFLQLRELEPSLQCQLSWLYQARSGGSEESHKYCKTGDEEGSWQAGREGGRLRMLHVLLGPQQSPIVNH